MCVSVRSCGESAGVEGVGVRWGGGISVRSCDEPVGIKGRYISKELW